jgi:hypothetical protein
MEAFRGERLPSTPVIELLTQLKIDEGLGRRDSVQAANGIHDAEEVRIVTTHELDQEVKAAAGDDDMGRFRVLDDFVGQRGN